MTPIPTVQKFRPMDLSLPLLQCYTWGRNNHGQLGLAGASQTSAPRAVSYLTSGASRGAGGVGRHVIKVKYACSTNAVGVVVFFGMGVVQAACGSRCPQAFLPPRARCECRVVFLR